MGTPHITKKEGPKRRGTLHTKQNTTCMVCVWVEPSVAINITTETLSYRSKLGPDLFFIILDMELEQQVERIRGRHGDDESAVRRMKVHNYILKHCNFFLFSSFTSNVNQRLK